MTQGILLFAHGRGTIDYGTIAQRCAERCRQQLNLPVAVITDLDLDASAFDHVLNYKADSGGRRHWPGTDITQDWYNVGRSRAFDLSPFDTTILLDTDFYVASAQLKILLDDPRPFLCHRQHMDLPNEGVRVTTIGKTKIPMCWATVVKFDRSDFSRGVFAAWQMIEKNYGHYAAMFGFKSRPFRNDYALSLALLLMSGNSTDLGTDIPWPLINITTGHEVVLGDTVEITYQRLIDNELKARRVSIAGLDMHVMDKRFL